MKNWLICTLVLGFSLFIMLSPTLIMVAASNVNDYVTFKRGQCFVYGRPTCERWEECPDYIYKILEVGKRKYRTVSIDMKTINKSVIGQDKLIMATNFYVIVSCPVELEGY